MPCREVITLLKLVKDTAKPTSETPYLRKPAKRCRKANVNDMQGCVLKAF